MAPTGAQGEWMLSVHLSVHLSLSSRGSAKEGAIKRELSRGSTQEGALKREHSRGSTQDWVEERAQKKLTGAILAL